MNAFTTAALVLVVSYVPLGAAILSRRPIDGVVALQLAGTISVLVLLCLAEGLHRSFEFGVAVVAAVLTSIGGVVFARFLGRWL